MGVQQQQDCVKDGEACSRKSVPYGEDKSKRLITNDEAVRLPTVFGEFYATVYQDDEGREHVALRMGQDLGQGPPPLVRVHSECLTGDVFGSIRCDCREQLITSLRTIAEEGRGVLIYLRQEGRGIGLANKLNAYSLQDRGLDTVDANLHLGFPADGRSFSIAGSILRSLGIQRIRLLTNNPQKINDLAAEQIEVVERVVQKISPRPENLQYLQTKAAKLGHMLDELIAIATPHLSEGESERPDES